MHIPGPSHPLDSPRFNCKLYLYFRHRQSPAWAKKAVAAGVFVSSGFIATFAAVVLDLKHQLNETPLAERATPVNRKIVLGASLASIVFGVVGCACAWATDYVTPPYEALVLANGPMYVPNKDEVYELLTYGRFANSMSTTDFELYRLCMTTTSLVVFSLVLLTGAVATSNTKLASMLAFVSTAHGWFVLTSVCLIRYKAHDAVAVGDKRLVTGAFILNWLSAMSALVAAGCILDHPAAADGARLHAHEASINGGGGKAGRVAPSSAGGLDGIRAGLSIQNPRLSTQPGPNVGAASADLFGANGANQRTPSGLPAFKAPGSTEL